MKKHFRLAAALLAILMLFTALVACDSSKPPEETKAQGTNEAVISTEAEIESVLETEFFPNVEENNYGSDFYLSIHQDSNPPWFYWVEESSNDVMSEALYNRQMKIQQYLGVNIIGSRTESSAGYVEPFQNAVKNKDGSVDTLLTHVFYGVSGFVSKNYLTDFQNIPQINLNAEYWNSDVMEQIEIADHKFLGYSDFNILYTHVVAFNKDMMSQYSNAIDGTLYDMVTDYRWTLDKMISIANLVSVDKSGDGKTIDDTFGIVGMHDIQFAGFMHSSNINLIERDDSGNYTVAVYNDLNKAKTTDVIEKISALVKSDSAWFWKIGTGLDVHFYDGNALMTLASTNKIPEYLEYNFKFGILPYPMYDEEQKNVGYRSLQWGGYIAVPSYVRNLDMVGDTLEMISFYSEDVNNAFYNKLLGKQVAESPVDKQMLEIVWDGICSDFCQTYYNDLLSTKLLYISTVLTYEDSNENVASFVAGSEKTINKMLKKLVASVESYSSK